MFSSFCPVTSCSNCAWWTGNFYWVDLNRSWWIILANVVDLHGTWICGLQRKWKFVLHSYFWYLGPSTSFKQDQVYFNIAWPCPDNENVLWYFPSAFTWSKCALTPAVLSGNILYITFLHQTQWANIISKDTIAHAHSASGRQLGSIACQCELKNKNLIISPIERETG